MYISKIASRMMIVVCFVIMNITFAMAQEVDPVLLAGKDSVLALSREHSQTIKTVLEKRDVGQVDPRSLLLLQIAHGDLSSVLRDFEEDRATTQENLTRSAISCITSSQEPKETCKEEMEKLTAFLDWNAKVRDMQLQLDFDLLVSKRLLRETN